MTDRRVRLLRLALDVIPKRALSAAASRLLAHPASRLLIPWYIRRYGVDLGDAAQPAAGYRSLEDLFTRKLRPGARPVDSREGVVIAPVDGVVAGIGEIRRGTLIQAKNMSFHVADLLGRRFPTDPLEGGSWATFYLSPRDYHRIHMPLEGRPLRAVRVPGTLYPVNRFGTQTVPGLFTRNERWITTFETPAGLMYLVEIGSVIVGSVRLTYAPELLDPPLTRREWFDCTLSGGDFLPKGSEIGYFSFGSTVILLFERDRVRWLPSVEPGTPVRMGQAVGAVLDIGKKGENP